MKNFILTGMIFAIAPMLYADYQTDYNDQNRNVRGMTVESRTNDYNSDYSTPNSYDNRQNINSDALKIRIDKREAAMPSATYNYQRETTMPSSTYNYQREAAMPSNTYNYQRDAATPNSTYNYQRGTYNEENRFTNERPYSRFNQPATPRDAVSEDPNFPKDSFTTDGDRKIGEKIREDLDKDFQHISIKVDNGSVTIRGTIADFDTKKDIEDNIRDIQGVRNVDNQLTVIKKNQ